MNHLTVTFTLVRRPAGRLLEVALGGADVRVVGTTTLSGAPDEILDALPVRREIVAISHADGSIYGLGSGEGRGLTCLGNLVDVLGFQSLDRRLHEEPAVLVSIGVGRLVEATRCLRKAMDKPLGKTVLDLRGGRPQLMSRTQVVALLVEALVSLSEAPSAESRGETRRPTMGDIFVDLIPLRSAAA